MVSRFRLYVITLTIWQTCENISLLIRSLANDNSCCWQPSYVGWYWRSIKWLYLGMMRTTSRELIDFSIEGVVEKGKHGHGQGEKQANEVDMSEMIPNENRNVVPCSAASWSCIYLSWIHQWFWNTTNSALQLPNPPHVSSRFCSCHIKDQLQVFSPRYKPESSFCSFDMLTEMLCNMTTLLPGC